MSRSQPTPAVRPAAPGAVRRTAGHTTAGRRSRDRILQASLDLITEAGIDRVRLAEIARRAAMSSGQVMYYFTSMEHILLETLAWREREETRQRRASLPAIGTGWPRLEEFVALYLPTSLTDPVWIMWMEAWARAPHSTEVSGFLDRLMSPWRDDLAQIVADGVQAGDFRAPDPAGDFPLRFCAVLDGLSVLFLRQMPDLSAERLTELALNTARAELKPV
ncbi:MAG TPA: TetR family transcriptional regulator C-terminal domain-containing protein [Streptosporangiaceae bacterium]|jgi:AcrR family transcriptional regulator|nr:TetR family transcriptional regulator C-terminal domain-containing protein [Streptosporangiaceae bacterium]